MTKWVLLNGYENLESRVPSRVVMLLHIQHQKMKRKFWTLRYMISLSAKSS